MKSRNNRKTKQFFGNHSVKMERSEIMSKREDIKQVIDRLPEYKLEYVASLILGIEKMSIEEVEPDEWDLKMIADAQKNNDGSEISLDELLMKEGLTYNDL